MPRSEKLTSSRAGGGVAEVRGAHRERLGQQRGPRGPAGTRARASGTSTCAGRRRRSPPARFRRSAAGPTRPSRRVHRRRRRRGATCRPRRSGGAARAADRRAGPGRAGRRDDAPGAPARRQRSSATSGRGRPRRCAGLVDGHTTQRHTDDPRRAVDRRVRLPRRVQHELGAVDAPARAAPRPERGQVRRRAAAYEHALGRRGETEQVAQPAEGHELRHRGAGRRDPRPREHRVAGGQASASGASGFPGRGTYAKKRGWSVRSP